MSKQARNECLTKVGLHQGETGLNASSSRRTEERKSEAGTILVLVYFIEI